MLLLLTVSVCSHLLGAEIHMLVEMAFKSNLSCLCHQWECSTYKVGTFFFFLPPLKSFNLREHSGRQRGGVILIKRLEVRPLVLRPLVLTLGSLFHFSEPSFGYH